MTLISVDATKCCHDGSCTEVCPLGLLSQPQDDGVPVMADGADEVCVHCGHCVAVCTTGALTHAFCPSAECEPLPDGWRLDPNRVTRLLKGRRSVRQYRRESVPRETLERLIDAARYAPTGQNAQSVGWLVLYDSAEVRQLAASIVDFMRSVVTQQPVMARALHIPWFVDSWSRGTDAVLRGAPHLVVAHGPQNDEISRMGCLMALGAFELAALSEGLGTCWAGYAMMLPGIEGALKLPAERRVFGAMMVGTPQHEYRRIPVRRPASIDWIL